jgi:hypothetical protein
LARGAFLPDAAFFAGAVLAPSSAFPLAARGFAAPPARRFSPAAPRRAGT